MNPVSDTLVSYDSLQPACPQSEEIFDKIRGPSRFDFAFIALNFFPQGSDEPLLVSQIVSLSL